MGVNAQGVEPYPICAPAFSLRKKSPVCDGLTHSRDLVRLFGGGGCDLEGATFFSSLARLMTGR